jgi:oxygen-independent coproporphyrinogen-3 oxidase
MVAKHEFEPLDPDASADLFELTADRTEAAGIPAYEISNHARAGQQSRHNLTYWRYGDYAGVGPGAHGRRLGQRTVRHRKPENFLSGLARNGHGIGEEATLDPREAADEALVMGLRLADGVDVQSIEDRFGVQPVNDVAVARLISTGHLERDGHRLRVTREGRLLLDSILGAIAAD